MYFHICETKALNRWKLVSYYEKGKKVGREREKGRERREGTNGMRIQKKKMSDRKVETEKERKIGSTMSTCINDL